MDDNSEAYESSQYPLNRYQIHKSFLMRPFGSHKTSKSGVGNNDRDPFGLTTVFNTLEDSEADVIFIHGLGGGSRSTWCKDGDVSLFWPQTWLPLDAAFKKTRIHIFGYGSNGVKESILNVNDFAKSLLEWTKNCPNIPCGENVSEGIIKKFLISQLFVCKYVESYYANRKSIR